MQSEPVGEVSVCVWRNVGHTANRVQELNMEIQENQFVEHPKDARFKDITGEVFGRLTVMGLVGRTGNGQRKILTWQCKCDCGNVVFVKRTGLCNTQSCGCYATDKSREKSVTHGLTGTPTYHAFVAAKHRCNNEKLYCYENYGGRGVEFRMQSVLDLVNDIGLRPGPEYSLDRVDNEAHYEVGNVRWATHSEQANNKRNTVWLTVDDVTKTLTECAAQSSLSRARIDQRVRVSGWCHKCAVTIPPRGGVCPHKK